MTVKHGCGLIAALTFVAALSFPGSATAQSYQWTGLATFSDYETDATTGQVVVNVGGTELATLSIDLYNVGSAFVYGDMTIAPLPWAGEVSGGIYGGVFGPSGISGSFDEGIGDEGVAYGAFSSDLQTFAVANFYTSLYDFDDNLFITESASFQAALQPVPEPSTLTLAGIGVLAVGIFMKSRRPLAPRKLRPGL
jgi:PEP-CTERM motif